jgi:hypothetical protein
MSRPEWVSPRSSSLIALETVPISDMGLDGSVGFEAESAISGGQGTKVLLILS